MERENISYTFSKLDAAVSHYPNFNNYNFIMKKSSFDNTFGMSSQAVQVSSCGKVYLENVNFTKNAIPNGFANLSSYILK